MKQPSSGPGTPGQNCDCDDHGHGHDDLGHGHGHDDLDHGHDDLEHEVPGGG